jgi:hypothetical protein
MRSSIRGNGSSSGGGGKDKAIPLQAGTGPEFEGPKIARQSSHESGKVIQSYKTVAFYPRETFLVLNFAKKNMKNIRIVHVPAGIRIWYLSNRVKTLNSQFVAHKLIIIIRFKFVLQDSAPLPAIIRYYI